MPKKIQNLSINVQDLMKLSPSQKIEIFQSTAGARIVSQLTPEQYASIFPRFFLERMRYDVSGFMSALSPDARDRLRNVLPGGESESSTGSGGARQRQPTATAPSIKNSVPTWMKELEKVAPGASDAKAKATLTPEQKEAIGKLKQGEIAADDPSLSFLAKQTPEARKAAGIETVERDGKQFFQYKAVTDEEAIAEARKKQSNKVTEVVSATPGVTVVKYEDGRIEKRSGTRNWRNNNPGNIEYGPFAKSKGAIGTDGRFAIFPSADMGRQAKQDLLFEGRGYRGLDIESAISRYAPPSENNTSSYISSVTQALGLPKNTKLSDLTPEQRKILLDTIQRVEGPVRGGKIDVLKEGLGIEGEITPQQIEASRKKIEEERETALATRPELPQGLDPKFVEQYNKMPVGQAQRVAQAIGNMGPEKFNEAFKKEPDKVLADTRVRQDGISPPPNAPDTISPGTWRKGNELPKTQSDAHKIVAEAATGTVKYQASVIDRAVHMLGLHERKDKETLKDFLKTGGKGMGVDPEATPWCAAFVNASLAQSGMRTTGSLVATSFLNWGEAKEASEVAAGDVLVQSRGRSAGQTGGHVGLSTGKTRLVNGQLQIEMLGGNQAESGGNGRPTSVSKVWVAADKLQIRRAREEDYNPDLLAEIKRGESTAATVSAVNNVQQNVSPAAPSPVGTPQEPFVAPSPAGADSRANATLQSQATPATSSSPTTQAATPATGSSTASQPQAATPATSSSTATQAPRTTPAVPAQVGTPQEAFTAPKPASQARPAVPATQQETSDDTIYVPAFSEGGNEEVKKTKKVEAYSIDHDNRNASLKGDDAVVVDAKSRDPLFTMNTTRETAVFDPATQSISVTPVDQSSDNESKPKSFVSVSKPDALSVPIFSMDTNDGTAKKYDPSTKNVNKSGTSDVKMKNNQKNSSSQISKANVYVKDKENLDNFVPVLAEGGEVDMSTDQTNNQPTDNKNVSVSNMGSMQTSAAQSVPNPTVAFSMAANPSFECPSFVRACGAVNGQRSTDPFGGHYDKFASNLA